MIRFNALAVAAMMATVTAGAAFAEDLPPEIKMAEVSVKEARGWYVRGDASYAVNTDHHGATLRSYDPSSGGYEAGSFDSTRFDGGDFSGDLGVGYQFSDLLRADVTADLFRGDFNAKFTDTVPCAGGAAGTGCSHSGSSSFYAGSLMLNGYVDLGTLAGFTPYVGAGLGATRIEWSNLNTASSCIDGAGSCSGGASTTRYSGQGDWRFTYALMAGVAYDLAPNMKLDLGYRYSHVAGGDMFGYSATDSVAGADGTMGRDQSLSRHEIRIGLRITTW